MKTKLMLAFWAFLVVTGVRAASVNSAAPAFALKDMQGSERSLKDFQNKVVLVNFWASWCPPCHQEFPELNTLAADYKAKGVEVVAINIDKTSDRVTAFLKKMKSAPLSLLILLDPNTQVVSKYKADSMPSTYIIDKTGTIRFVHVGYNAKDPAQWRTEIDGLLSKR